MLKLGEVTFVPQGVGVHLPADPALADGYLEGAAIQLRAPFVVDGQTSPIHLLRMPTYVPMVDVTTEKSRDKASSIARGHKHRMWLLHTDISTERDDSAQRMAEGLLAWQAQTPYRVIATPGVELSPYNLNWTQRMMDEWGGFPNFFLFDIDLSGYDRSSDWRKDVSMLIQWLERDGMNLPAILTVTLPTKSMPNRIYDYINQMWEIAKSNLRIVGIICNAHFGDSFADSNLNLTRTGKIYVDWKERHAHIRGNAQETGAAGRTT